MDQVLLGKTKLTISPIVLGTAGFGTRLDEASCYRLMDYAVEQGINFFDTAEKYGDGESERVIGKWMHSRGCRGEVCLTTKILKSAQDIQKGLSDCLERLDTGHVEILEMHEFAFDVPLDEVLHALTEEVEASRVHVIGCSNFTAAQLTEALDVSIHRGYCRFQVFQPQYNLVMTPVVIDHRLPVGLPEVENELLPLCRKERIAVTPYSPLGGGMLTGKYQRGQAPPSGSRLADMTNYANDYLTNRNFGIVDRLRTRAREMGVPMAQLAMAWVMTHPDVTATVIGPQRPEHIDLALAAYDMRLDPNVRKEMTSWAR